MVAVTKEDPFAGKGDNVTPIKRSAEGDEGTGVSLTIKGGAGYEAPWVVARYPSIEDAWQDITDEVTQNQLKDLFSAVADASGAFIKSVSAVTPPKGGGRAAAAVGAPSGTPAAPGPDWTYKEGFSKGGKAWKAWMPPRGSDESPVWL